MTDFLVDSMDNRTQVDTVYTDFSKAFDKISFPLLIVQLAGVGVCAFLHVAGSPLFSAVQQVGYRHPGLCCF